MKRNYLLVLIIALIIRIIISISTYHSDVAPFIFAGKVIGDGNIINFYDYLWELPSGHVILNTYPRNLFNYPPLVYFFLGTVARLFTFFIPIKIINSFLFNIPELVGNINLNIMLLMLKLPYIFFDIPIGFLLMKIFKEDKDKYRAFTLWMFNPINLYTTYAMGQFDVIPTFFVVSCLIILTKYESQKKYLLAGLSIGLGAAFKIFPFLLLVPIFSIRAKRKYTLLTGLVGVFTYFAFVLPFIGSPGFRRTALFAGQLSKSFVAGINVSQGETIILFPTLLLFIYLLYLSKPIDAKYLWERFFAVLLLFFIFTHFHLQWFLWITPFLIIDLIDKKFRNIFACLALLFSYFGMMFFYDPGLTVRLFSPIFPVLFNYPSIWNMLGLTVDYNMSRSLLQSIFVGASLYYLVNILKPLQIIKTEDR